MCKGALRGLALLKFSLSINRKGFLEIRIITNSETIKIKATSFVDIREWNFILSKEDLLVIGFVEPFEWMKIKWRTEKKIKTKGKMKCNEKNRVRVAWERDLPPQIHKLIDLPTKGRALIVPVITVAPQNDICPHGRT